MAKTKTSKPCPQCGGTMHRALGETAGRVGPWPAICHRCRDLIEKGKEAEERDQARKGFEEFNLPLGDAWPLHYPAQDNVTIEHIVAIRRALSEALTGLAEPALRQDGYGGDIFHYLPYEISHRNWRRVLISKDSAEKIRRLHARLQEGFNEIFKAGVSEGQNLLKQLATGAISTEAFDSVERPRPPSSKKKS